MIVNVPKNCDNQNSSVAKVTHDKVDNKLVSYENVILVFFSLKIFGM